MSRVVRRVIVSRRLAKAFLLQVSSATAPEVVVLSPRPNVFMKSACSDPTVEAAVMAGHVTYRVSRDQDGRSLISFIGPSNVLARIRAHAESRDLQVGGMG